MWCVYYPDHIHCIWVLPEGDTNYSIRWKEIKRIFTQSYWDEIGPGEVRNESRLMIEEAAVWQDGVLRKGMGRGCRG